MNLIDLRTGNCLDLLKTLPENSVDSIVTDPPYGLKFMGKKWDYDVPSVEIWAECLRVLKPGGHLLAFAGTRTQHRMACRIEDAGFEIRDMIAWVYGSGFPKSLDVSKAIDAAAGADREVVGTAVRKTDRDATSLKMGRVSDEYNITAPATEAAKTWEGWGTALKPALEPITMARKPLVGTVAENVLTHGTGGINVDGCRAPTSEEVSNHGRSATANGWGSALSGKQEAKQSPGQALGRWPANLIHDGSSEVLAHFPNNGVAKPARVGLRGGSPVHGQKGMGSPDKVGTWPADEGGSAARFFYCAKASKHDRNEGLDDFETIPNTEIVNRDADSAGINNPRAGAGRTSGAKNPHPTVKPTELMRYLCRLVTPPGGTVLDPFMGSGSTGRAAIKEGFAFIGMEMDPEFVRISEARIRAA